MDYDSLHQRARAAGNQAGADAIPVPMVVGSPVSLFNNVLDRSRPVYVVESGVCGFASVVVRGNSGFGRYAKRAGLARPAYPSGLAIPVREFGQSLARKEAYANAYARVLNEAGVSAYVDSRMD